MHGRAPEEPGAELALLTARQADDGARVVGASLDHGQRLQHRVVQVRRHLGALVGPDALAPLLHERVGQSPQPRAEDQCQAADHHHHGHEPLPERLERALRREERRHPADDERDTDDHPADRLGAARAERRCRAGNALVPDHFPDQLVDRLAAAPDDQRGAHRRQHDRPHHRVRQAQAGRLCEQQHAEHHTAQSRELHDIEAAAPLVRTRRRTPVVGGEPQPAREVQHDARAAGQREHHERESHQVGLDAVVPADAVRDAGDELAVGSTRQPASSCRVRVGAMFHVPLLDWACVTRR